MNEKALEAAVRAVWAHYYDLGFRLKPAPARLAAQAAISAYLAAMEADGFVMVPVEPTEAMLAQTSYVTGMNDAPMADWLAMIAASTTHDDGGE